MDVQELYQKLAKNELQEGFVCLLNLPINVCECSVILENTALERNRDVSPRSCMNLIMKQIPLPFQKVQWKKM